MNEKLNTVEVANKQSTPEIELELNDLEYSLQQMDKAISVARETFSRLDVVANRVNPDRYYKNIPNDGRKDGGVECEPEKIRSGYVLRIKALNNVLTSLCSALNTHTNETVAPTVEFFNDNL